MSEDEFAELETTNGEFDRMMSDGDPVTVVSFGFPDPAPGGYKVDISGGGGLASADSRSPFGTTVESSTSGAPTATVHS